MRQKIVYVISDLNKALAFEWISEKINKERFFLSFIFLNKGHSELQDYLIQRGFNVYEVNCRGKMSWPFAFFKVHYLLRTIKPDVVHCHLFQATVIGLTAARMSGIKKRIYTRHHSSLHHVYFKKGIWWDKLSNRLATKIIAISGVVKKILIKWEKVPENKVVLIPHAFDLNEFSEVDDTRVRDFKKRNDLIGTHPVVGVISRLTEWKGVQYVIPAFQEFLVHEPNAVLVLLNAKGDYEIEIRKLLSNLPATSYRIISFENDIAAAYKAMDIFVHVPIDEHSEAFGQIYVESLAAEIPSVFSLSGIASDFITDNKNALVVPFKDSQAIYKAMLKLISDAKLRAALRKEGVRTVQEKFQLENMINSLETLYAD